MHFYLQWGDSAGGMADMSRLDDDEQYEWIRRWSTKQRRMQAEILQVRKLMDEGKSTKEIAEAIGRPVNSVGRYIKRIREGKA